MIVSETSTDGRRARRDRNSDNVIESLLDLINEGNVWPSAQEVADRAGVSLRSVFRYFDDLDALLEAAMDRQFDRSAHLFAAPRPANTLQGRIDALVDSRLEMYEGLATISKAVRTRAAVRPRAAEFATKGRAHMRSVVESYLAADLEAVGPDAPMVVEALVMLLCFEALEALTEVQGMSREQSYEVLRNALRRVLDPTLCCVTPSSFTPPARSQAD